MDHIFRIRLYKMRYLSKSYSLILTVFLLILTANCIHIGGQKVLATPASVHTEVAYYSNGQKEYAAEYLNGRLDGKSQHWAADGFLISESQYSNGKLHGSWKKYYANQKIMYEAHYFHGQKHGQEKWYYENGQIKSEQSFYYGNPSDTIIRWYPNGSIIY